jgi:hypothetical protein
LKTIHGVYVPNTRISGKKDHSGASILVMKKLQNKMKRGYLSSQIGLRGVGNILASRDYTGQQSERHNMALSLSAVLARCVRLRRILR